MENMDTQADSMDIDLDLGSPIVGAGAEAFVVDQEAILVGQDPPRPAAYDEDLGGGRAQRPQQDKRQPWDKLNKDCVVNVSGLDEDWTSKDPWNWYRQHCGDNYKPSYTLWKDDWTVNFVFSSVDDARSALYNLSSFGIGYPTDIAPETSRPGKPYARHQASKIFVRIANDADRPDNAGRPNSKRNAQPRRASGPQIDRTRPPPERNGVNIYDGRKRKQYGEDVPIVDDDYSGPTPELNYGEPGETTSYSRRRDELSPRNGRYRWDDRRDQDNRRDRDRSRGADYDNRYDDRRGRGRGRRSEGMLRERSASPADGDASYGFDENGRPLGRDYRERDTPARPRSNRRSGGDHWVRDRADYGESDYAVHSRPSYPNAATGRSPIHRRSNAFDETNSLGADLLSRSTKDGKPLVPSKGSLASRITVDDGRGSAGILQNDFADVRAPDFSEPQQRPSLASRITRDGDGGSGRSGVSFRGAASKLEGHSFRGAATRH